MKPSHIASTVLIMGALSLVGCVSSGGKTSNSAQSSKSTSQGSLSEVLISDKVIAIPVFRINFMKKFNASARQESSSWTSSASASVHAFVQTVGFDEKVLQSITNQAYDDLVVRLKNKKYNIMSISDASKKSKSLAEEAQDKDYPDIDNDESIYLASKTMYPSGFTAVSKGRLLKAPSAIEELKAGVFAINYTLDFVASKEETDKISGWNNSSLSASIALSPAISVSGVIQSFSYAKGQTLPFGGFISPSATLTMSQRAISSLPFAKGKIEKTTSAGMQTAQAAVNVLGLLMGSKTKSSADDYTLTVDESKMVKAALDALKKANQQWVSKL